MPETPEPPVEPRHWQAFFATVAEPVFILNRQRRIILVNRAWEDLTGVTADRARGLACKRVKGAPGETSLAAALAPPADALAGKTTRVRRRLGGSETDPCWFDVEFVPLMAADGLLAILGRLTGTLPRLAPAAASLPEKLHNLQRRLAARYRLDASFSSLPALTRATDQARLASQTRAAVLLVGEPGTGKEWLARAIHHHGGTADTAFAAVHCARLPRGALVELLQGATSLMCRRAIGTLYLKEPACLPLDVQAKLRADLAEPAAERPRVVAGASTGPDQDVRAGRLLDELRCALGTLEITLPPLRERPADLSALAEQLLARSGGDGAQPPTGLAAEAWEAIRAYRWPGNLDELYDVLLSARRAAKDARIELAHLPAYLRQAVRLEDSPGRSPPRQMPLKLLRDQVERRLIALALRMAKGNKSEAARLLAIERLSLLNRMKALGMETQKSEIRNPKSETNPKLEEKSEIRNPKSETNPKLE
jgi:DNA-binding NtrC family response regulator